MIRDVLTIAIVAFAISFVAITEVMLSLMYVISRRRNKWWLLMLWTAPPLGT